MYKQAIAFMTKTNFPEKEFETYEYVKLIFYKDSYIIQQE